MTGTIFNIQRFSIHDGPGIRTTVFLKGCNLHCFWCHNPEAVNGEPEIQFFPEKCIACGACVEICPEGAQLLADNQRTYLRELCQVCGRCTDECFSGALVLTGKQSTTPGLLQEIERDAEYYRQSGGGVTFSGGEPMLQFDFLLELLQQCRSRGYHCAVDTAGNVPWSLFEVIAPLTDLFLFDVKAFDPETHRLATGLSNQRILQNLQRLSTLGKPIWIRIPVIPGVNDSDAEIEHIGGFLAPLPNIAWVELLPFHTLGSEKYASLGREYPAAGLKTPTLDRLAELQAILTGHNLAVRCMA